MTQSSLNYGLEHKLVTRENHFNFVRLLLAFLVCFDHAGLIVAGVNGSEMLQIAGISSGYLAVNGFFFLSGILIARSLQERGVSKYYFASRLLRLFPALVVLALIATFIIGPAVATGTYWIGPQTFSYALEVLSFGDVSGGPIGFYPENPLAGEFAIPLWTLRYELLCYLGAPLVILLGLHKQRALLALGTMLLAGIYIYLPFAERSALSSALVHNLVRFAFCFALGMTIWLYREKVSGQLSWVIVTLVAFIVCGLLGVGEFVTGTLFVSAGLLSLGLRLPFKTNLQTDLSYGIYIWHYPVMQILFGETGGIGEWSLLLLSIPIVFVISWISWSFMERPALKFRKHV